MQKKVLVVDDIPINCKIITMHLNKLGYECDSATSGEHAVALCITNRYWMIFMDLDMPGMTGFHATKLIREHEKATGRHSIILAMSSFDRIEDKQRCIREGMDAHLNKGLSAQELQLVIADYATEDTGTAFPSLAAMRSAAETQEFDSELNRLNSRFGAKTTEIVSEFVFCARFLMEELERVLVDRKPSELTRVAYSLKGACSNLGLSTMAKACVDMSDYGYAGRWHRVSAKYRTLSKMLTAVQEKLGGSAERAS